MRTLRTSLWLTLALFLVTAALSPLQAATWDIDGNHSSAIFKVKHLDIAYFYGAFKDVSGTIEYDPANPGASSIDVTIDAASVDSRNANRDEHIRSPDFLNAKQFPVITFKGKAVSADGDDLEITGTLTMHGVSKEVTVTATRTGSAKHPRSGKDIVGFHSEFTVKRSDFDMEFMIGPLADEITFILSIEAAQQ